MKLEELLGEELFKQVQAKLDEVNGKEADPLKHVRYADLSEGGYVAKDKYSGLEAKLSGKETELGEANKLIAELKKATNKDETLQEKIKDYETQIANLNAENERLRTETALKFALMNAGATDIDYMMFKAKEKGEVRLKDDGSIEGISGLITELKMAHPTMFAGGEAGKNILENNLPGGSHEKTVTKEQFKAMGYEERLALKKENETLYNNLKGR